MLESDTREKVPEKMLGVHLPINTIEKFKDLARKERKTMKVFHKDIIDKYLKEHGDGNPAFTLDVFVEQPTMQAAPAFYRTREDWHEYSYNSSSEEVKKILNQAQTIVAVSKNTLLQRGENEY